MASFVTIEDVRNYIGVTKTDGTYSDGIIGSNIRAASDFLQVRTGRQFEAQTAATKTFTTHGRAAMRIPDLRTATTVTLDDTVRTENDDFWLESDYHNRGVYTGIQFRHYERGHSIYGNRLWFDKGYDLPDYRRFSYVSTPNNLSILGNWGWDPLPEELIHAATVLAGWYTRRPDSLLSDVVLTPEGGFQRFSEFPPEVQSFIEGWRISEMAVAT